MLITPGLIAERVGNELLVIVPGRTDTVRLTAHAADLFLDIQAGEKVDASDPAVAKLVDLGIVQASGLSRRGLVKAGAIGAVAGIAVMAMPSVAAASSTFRIVAMSFIFGSPDGDNYTSLMYEFGSARTDSDLVIPNDTPGVFALSGLPGYSITFLASGYSMAPFLYNYLTIATPGLPQSYLPGQTATITFASLNLRGTFFHPEE